MKGARTPESPGMARATSGRAEPAVELMDSASTPLAVNESTMRFLDEIAAFMDSIESSSPEVIPRDGAHLLTHTTPIKHLVAEDTHPTHSHPTHVDKHSPIGGAISVVGGRKQITPDPLSMSGDATVPH